MLDLLLDVAFDPYEQDLDLNNDTYVNGLSSAVFCDINFVVFFCVYFYGKT